MKTSLYFILLTALLSACSESSTDNTAVSTDNTDGSTNNNGTVSGVNVIGNCTPGTLELDLIKAHNTARAQARNCGGQQMPAVAALSYSCKLAEASLNHSNDMASVDFFEHTGSDGSDVGQRLSNVGYSFQAWGENISAGSNTVTEVMQGWLNSPGHCQNIMQNIFTEMGGARVDTSTATYSSYWTVDFAMPR